MRPNIILLCLWTLLIGILFFKIYIQINDLDLNAEYVDKEEQLDILKRENTLLEDQYLQTASYQTIEREARGFVPQTVIYLTNFK